MKQIKSIASVFFYWVLGCFHTTHCCFGLIAPSSTLLCWSALPLVMLPGPGHLCMCCTHSIKVDCDMKWVEKPMKTLFHVWCSLERLCTGGLSSPDASNDHPATARLQHLPCTDMFWFKHEDRSNTPVIPSLGTVRACPGTVDSAPHLHHSRVQGRSRYTCVHTHQMYRTLGWTVVWYMPQTPRGKTPLYSFQASEMKVFWVKTLFRSPRKSVIKYVFLYIYGAQLCLFLNCLCAQKVLNIWLVRLTFIGYCGYYILADLECVDASKTKRYPYLGAAGATMYWQHTLGEYLTK